MEKRCEICGNIFHKKVNVSKKKWAVARFCSIECLGKSNKKTLTGRKVTWGDKISEAKKGHSVSEETRNKISESQIGRKQQEKTILKKSGVNCHFWKGGKPDCKRCGKGLSNYGTEYCRECCAILKLSARIGEKNHNWKGGISSYNDKLRQSVEVKRWKKECKKRDNNVCQKYFIVNTKLVVHHINSFANFPELRTELSNGITFSEKAHKEFHRKYGYKNSTKEQLNKFLLRV